MLHKGSNDTNEAQLLIRNTGEQKTMEGHHSSTETQIYLEFLSPQKYPSKIMEK